MVIRDISRKKKLFNEAKSIYLTRLMIISIVHHRIFCYKSADNELAPLNVKRRDE